MTPEQERALRLIFERAAEHPLTARVNVIGINRLALTSLVDRQYLTLNNDKTVTLTKPGLLAVLRLPPKHKAPPIQSAPNGTNPGDQDGQP